MRQKHSPLFNSLLSLICISIFPALLMCAGGGATFAQSGRRAPKSNLPPSPPVTTATIPEPSGESESIPRGSAPKANPAQVSLAVLEIDNPFLNSSYVDTDLIIASFVKRLSDSAMLSVKPGGKTDRKAARDRAKNETDTHVVAVELDEDSMNGRGSIGRTDPATLILKYYIYTPRTGSLKRQGRVDQRPYSGSTRIGRVRVPLPTPRGRVVQDYVLEQLGRDAADRVMAAFSVIPPPE
ncbi:MAG TPA: hypothetical protein VM866_05785 [Pyrinomonadaceae bacterium]|nr:hypothetical protein [Pyrinomonadaceae bacterium]